MIDKNTENGLADAVRLLSDPTEQAVLLVPTETVYGLVCRWDSAPARNRIYEMKRRPQEKRLAAFVSDSAMLKTIAPTLPPLAIRLMDAFCPGPITIVVPDGHGDTFGFRIPDHPFLLRLLPLVGTPLASTSANLSGTPAALSVPMAMSTLASEPDLAIDGGEINGGSKASTVVSVRADNTWQILRPGPISAKRLAAVAAISC